MRNTTFRGIAFLGLVAVATAPLVGCGRYKTRDDRIASVELRERSERSQEDEELLRKLKEIYELYADEDGISRDGLNRLVEKYKSEVDRLLSGQRFIITELLDMFFNFDKESSGGDGNGKIDLEEIVNGLTDTIPTLKWIPDEGTASREELLRKIELDYAGASEQARNGLADTLMNYDLSWAGGNADDRLSRREIAVAGIIIAFMDKTNFSRRLRLTPDVPEDKRMVYMMLDRSMNKQIFGRYRVADYKTLPETDTKLEWMQLAVRFHQVDRMVNVFDGGLGARVFGIPDAARWPILRMAYDSRFLRGDEDGKLNTIEAFLFITDTQYAQKVLDFVDGQLTPRNLVGKRYLFEHLLTLYPYTAHNLFLVCPPDRRGEDDPDCATDVSELKNKRIRSGYFTRNLPDFDLPKRGGDGNGQLDRGELALAFLYATLLDYLFASYDGDGDRMISKEEAFRFMQKRTGLDDRRVVDAFFADVGLDTDGPDFWERLSVIFTGRSSIDRLRPYSFYRRMEKIIQKLFLQPPG